MNEGLHPDPAEPPQAAGGAGGPGLVHVVYGNGVGKTSRCIGLAVRAAGAGLKVAWVQFMKGPGSSEVKAFARLPGLSFHCPGPHAFIRGGESTPAHRAHAARGLAMAREALAAGAQVIVADEILNTLLFGTLELAPVLGLMAVCRGRAELVMSGAAVPPEVVAAADYVTELRLVKHPYQRGVAARRGVEY